MKFFKPDKTEINKKEFVNFYNSSYFLGGSSITGVSQNSKFVEDEIDGLLEDGIKNEIDVIHILAWKVGKIKHRESQEQKPFKYAADWIGAESYQMKRYGKNFDVSDFVKYIVSNVESLKSESKKNPQSVLNKLRDKAPKGIGTVYLITILYFISKGEYPIYDRFAQIAVDAITNEIEPGSSVVYKKLPGKNEKGFSTVMNYYEDDYIKKIEKIFGKKYKDSRDIDRALWVYGHTFISSKNC